METATTGSDTAMYDYDFRGNLRAVMLPDSTTVEYLTDGRDRRIGRKVNGTLDRRWVYKDQLNPVAELDASGNIVAEYVYATKPNVPDLMITATAMYRIISDHLGSVRLVIDATTGAVAQRMDYDEFGNVLLDTNSGFQPFGYAGGIYDSATGLVRFGARDYDAVSGRWTAKDPIGFRGGDPNLFAYVRADPLNETDPSGLLSKWLIQKIYDSAKKQLGKYLGKQLGDDITSGCHGECDLDGNGVLDFEEDWDGDGIPNLMDDSDGDGILDFADEDMIEERKKQRLCP